jgi:hypothetical protein
VEGRSGSRSVDWTSLLFPFRMFCFYPFFFFLVPMTYIPSVFIRFFKFFVRHPHFHRYPILIQSISDISMTYVLQTSINARRYIPIPTYLPTSTKPIPSTNQPNPTKPQSWLFFHCHVICQMHLDKKALNYGLRTRTLVHVLNFASSTYSPIVCKVSVSLLFRPTSV